DGRGGRDRIGELGDEGLGRRQLGGERGEGLLVATAEDQVVVGGELMGEGPPDPPVRPGDEDGGTGGRLCGGHAPESGTTGCRWALRTRTLAPPPCSGARGPPAMQGESMSGCRAGVRAAGGCAPRCWSS